MILIISETRVVVVEDNIASMMSLHLFPPFVCAYSHQKNITQRRKEIKFMTSKERKSDVKISDSEKRLSLVFWKLVSGMNRKLSESCFRVRYYFPRHFLTKLDFLFINWHVNCLSFSFNFFSLPGNERFVEMQKTPENVFADNLGQRLSWRRNGRERNMINCCSFSVQSCEKLLRVYACIYHHDARHQCDEYLKWKKTFPIDTIDSSKIQS